jgi:phospholipase/lecithinase/hemolysin
MRLLLAAALLASAVPSAAFAPTGVVVFGDSFTDAGNIAAATGGTIPDPNLGYWRGRFSDGPTFADLLSSWSTGSATRASLTGGTNFAFGGARAAVDDVIAPGVAIPGLATQLVFSGIPFAPAVDPTQLYIVSFGNNDVSALLDGDTEGLTPEQYKAQFASTYVGAVQLLAAKGAQHILIAGVPNPTRGEGPELQALLDAGLDALEPTIPGTTLYRFDWFDFFGRLVADPTQFGLAADLDFVNNCLETVGPFQECAGFLSFDGIHVTEEVQFAIAREMGRQFGLPVPEVATWAMMIAGFGLVGMAARRRPLEESTS